MSSNKESINSHRCEKTNVTVIREMFMNDSKNLGIGKKTNMTA